MIKSNKTTGNQFEAELCEKLAERGWWAHNLAQNQAGQPADIIAVKNNIAVLIDCKECKNNKFSLSRIEGNQEGAMHLWRKFGNNHCYFAVRLNTGEIYCIHYGTIRYMENNKKTSINEKELRECLTFDEWCYLMEKCI